MDDLSTYSFRDKLVLPTLSFTRYVTTTPSIAFGLLLIEIGMTFNTPVGVTGQIGTVYSILGVLTAITMGVVSVRFNHKFMLLIGFLILFFSAIGISIASSFLVMALFYSICGLSYAIVQPMSATLVAEYFPTDMRPTVFGWLVAGASLSYVIGAQLISRIASIGGWRSAFLWYATPLGLFGLLMGKYFLPELRENRESDLNVSFLTGFRAIFKNRSALFCLVTTALRGISFQVILLYSISLLRQEFSIPRSIASIIMTFAALSYTIGSLVAGRLTTKYGRRNLSSISVLIASLLAIIFTFSSNLWLALITDFVSAWFFGMSMSSGQSLNLEQLPSFRGTMMSLTSAFANTGSAFGAALGGVVILNYSYRLLGTSLGIFGVASSIIYYTLTVDPTML